MPQRVEVCPVEDLQPGERTIVEVDGLPHSVGVFNVDGEFYALANVCPHHLAPLCEGEITGEMESEGVGDFQPTREGEVIRCPWHGWKFDITDGRSMFNPHELRTRAYETDVETRSDAAENDESTADGCPAEVEEYGTELSGDAPPIDTYDVDIDEEIVVLLV